MPKIVAETTMPIFAPASRGGISSRQITAYIGTMPPWNRPKMPDTTNRQAVAGVHGKAREIRAATHVSDHVVLRENERAEIVGKLAIAIAGRFKAGAITF